MRRYYWVYFEIKQAGFRLGKNIAVSNELPMNRFFHFHDSTVVNTISIVKHSSQNWTEIPETRPQSNILFYIDIVL